MCSISLRPALHLRSNCSCVSVYIDSITSLISILYHSCYCSLLFPKDTTSKTPRARPSSFLLSLSASSIFSSMSAFLYILTPASTTSSTDIGMHIHHKASLRNRRLFSSTALSPSLSLTDLAVSIPHLPFYNSMIHSPITNCRQVSTRQLCAILERSTHSHVTCEKHFISVFSALIPISRFQRRQTPSLMLTRRLWGIRVRLEGK